MKKPLIIGIVLLILAFWGHLVLVLIGEALILMLETLELVTETVLEALLALTPYEAQMVTAWLGLGLFVLMLIIALKKLVALTQTFRTKGPIWWQEEKARLKAMTSSIGWPLGVAGLVLIIALLYL